MITEQAKKLITPKSAYLDDFAALELARVATRTASLALESINPRAFMPDESERRGCEATPQTLTKSTRGTIERIIENDRRREARGQGTVLKPQHLAAAQEIERVYVAIVQSLMPKRMSFERRDPTNRDPGLIVPETLRRAYRERYKPWADRLSASRALNGPPIHQTVIDILIDGKVATDLDREHHHRRGTCVRWLVYGLDLYGRMAGWTK